MMKFSGALAVIALAILATPAAIQAQEVPGTAQTPESGLSLGQEIVDDSAIGATYVREIFDDWEMRCVRTEDEKDPCQLYQLMRDTNENPVAEISLFELPTGQEAVAGATVAAPLETLLTEQLTLSVDDGSTKRYPFTYCGPQGCYARIGLTENDIAAFTRGAAATLVIVPVAAPTQRIGLKLSLIGFTKGYAAVVASNAAILAE